MFTIDKDLQINILQRKLNEAEQRATELEALFIMVQNELKIIKEGVDVDEA